MLRAAVSSRLASSPSTISSFTFAPKIVFSAMSISTSDDVPSATSAYDFVVLDAKKAKFALAERKGNPTLIVNVASKCGLTKDSYASLAILHERYKNKGFTVLGFPCNQFANQEPGSDEEIAQLACTRFSANFPILAKVDVNGEHASPVWQWLKKKKPGFLGTEAIKWNFTSFLVDADGQVVERYSPGVKVEDVEKSLLPLLRASRNDSTEEEKKSSTLLKNSKL